MEPNCRIDIDVKVDRLASRRVAPARSVEAQALQILRGHRVEPLLGRVIPDLLHRETGRGSGKVILLRARHDADGGGGAIPVSLLRDLVRSLIEPYQYLAVGQAIAGAEVAVGADLSVELGDGEARLLDGGCNNDIGRDGSPPLSTCRE